MIAAFALVFAVDIRSWWLIAATVLFACLGGAIVSPLVAPAGRFRDRALTLMVFGGGAVLAAFLICVAMFVVFLVIVWTGPPLPD